MKIKKLGKFGIISLIIVVVITIVNMCALGLSGRYYANYAFLSLAFFAAYLFFLYPAICKNNKLLSYTTTIFTLISFARYEIYPFLLIFSEEGYTGKRYVDISENEINLAVLLMCLELLAGSLLIWVVDQIYEKRAKTDSVNKEIAIREDGFCKLYGNRAVYAIYIAVAAVIYIAVGRRNQVINFIAYDIEEEGYVALDSTWLVLVRQIVVIAVYLIFLVGIDFAKKKYDKSDKVRFVILAILFAAFNISIIVGNRRSVQIYICVISILMLTRMFPKHKKRVILIILISVAVVLGSMTLYRLGAHRYGSYEAAITNTDFNLSYVLDNIQVYLGEPESVATGIAYSYSGQSGVSQLLFDFGRNMFGMNFLLKDGRYITSQLYNLFIYNNKQATGQLMFSSSYGYMFFGTVFSPLILVFNLALAIILEKGYKRAKYYETKYLLGYCFLRVILNYFVNTPTIISIVTQQFMTFGLLILAAGLFNRRFSPYKKSTLTGMSVAEHDRIQCDMDTRLP